MLSYIVVSQKFKLKLISAKFLFLVISSVTSLKQEVTWKWRWRIDVDAGLVFILNIDTGSQFQEKQKVFEEREEHKLRQISKVKGSLKPLSVKIRES